MSVFIVVISACHSTKKEQGEKEEDVFDFAKTPFFFLAAFVLSVSVVKATSARLIQAFLKTKRVTHLSLSLSIYILNSYLSPPCFTSCLCSQR